MLEGDYKEQYKRLGNYVAELRRTNLGTTIIIKLDMLIFKRFYICLDACKKGFLAGCRPIIGIDGCFLKTRYGGQPLSAVGMDANNCMYLIAYAIVKLKAKPPGYGFYNY